MDIIYNKLVRDLIPQIIEKSGKTAVASVLDPKGFISELKLKLREEMDEYLENGEIEELCDVIEVVYALAEASGVTIDELHELRRRKAEANGVFERRVYLEKVIQQ